MGYFLALKAKAKIFTDAEAKKIVADFISKNQVGANPNNNNATGNADENLAKGREYLAKLATEAGINKNRRRHSI